MSATGGMSHFDKINRKVLRRSIVFTVLMTVLGLTVGFLTSSQVIMFDGVFNLVGVALSTLSILATNFVRQKDTLNYPFGKEALEPFIALAQYCIILFLCVTNIVNAVQTIMAGGHSMNLSSGLLYGALAAGLNIFIVIYFKTMTKKYSTIITDSEITQWVFSCLLSSEILLGFGISMILERTMLTFFRCSSA